MADEVVSVMEDMDVYRGLLLLYYDIANA